jgi:AraC-like DNA-binding protein
MAPLLGLPRFLADHGLDPDTEIHVNGCDPTLFRDPDNTIDFSAVGRLLEHTARVTGCPYPGLEIGRRLDLNVLGPVGEAVRLAPDVGTALRTLILDFHLHDRGAVPSLWESGREAMFGYTLYCPDVPGTEHIYDGALAIAQNFLVELSGPNWQATEVRLYREKPKDVGPYRRHFRGKLRFGTQIAAIVFPAADLSRPLAGADPIAFARTLQELDEMRAVSDAGLASKVRRLLRRLLVTGSAPDGIDLSGVAQMFALHPRTFNRRLRAEGTTFSSLLSEVRYEIARQLLRDTQLQASDIAFSLGYADCSSFNHAFRRWSGTNATAWRSFQKSD